MTAAPTSTTLISTLSSISSQTKGYYALQALITAAGTTNQGLFPSGDVTFTRSDGTVLASAVFTQGFYSGTTPAAVSTAYLSANALSLGNNSITATFTPNSGTGYSTSTSTAVNISVGSTAGLTNAHLTVGTADGGNVYYDTMSPVTINASVIGAGTPTGTVALFADGSLVGNMTSLGNGQWTYSFTSTDTSNGLLPLPPGNVTLLAQYSGDAANSSDRQYVQLTILDDQQRPDFLIQASQPYKIIASGTTTMTLGLQLTPVNGFSGTVTISSTAPPGATCGIPSPGTINLGSKMFVSTTLTCTGLPTAVGNYSIDVTATSSIATTTPNITTTIVHDVPVQITVQ